MKGISRAAFAALFLVIFFYPLDAFASCVVASSGFANLLSTICWLLGLFFILAFLIKLIPSKKAKRRKKSAGKAKYVFLCVGIVFIALPFIIHSYSLLPEVKRPNERSYESYPCCTAMRIERNRMFSPEPIQCVGCRQCPDSVAFKPPIEPEQVLKNDMLMEGRQYLFTHLFPVGTDIDIYEKTLSGLGLRKVNEFCSQPSKTFSAGDVQSAFIQYVPAAMKNNQKIMISAWFDDRGKLVSINVERVRDSIDYKTPMGRFMTWQAVVLKMLITGLQSGMGSMQKKT